MSKAKIDNAHGRDNSSAGADVGDECLRGLARRLARACRRVIQACLREEEWRDADEEFYDVILAGLRELEARNETKRRSGTR
ncbi:MAG TPA: hypothetical protein VHC22_12940 [Pirellulales bacterium]|nr:hypothetical protein [Pirellulales bacterium]